LENEELRSEICCMIKCVHNNDSLKRIYNLIMYLIRNKKAV